MTRFTYEVVEHDGGWAYNAERAFSEPFPSHEDACRAAEHAARGQRAPGEAASITTRTQGVGGTTKFRKATIGPTQASSVEVVRLLRPDV